MRAPSHHVEVISAKRRFQQVVHFVMRARLASQPVEPITESDRRAMKSFAKLAIDDAEALEVRRLERQVG